MQNYTVSVYRVIWSLQKKSISVDFLQITKAMAKLKLGTPMKLSTLELLKMIGNMARVFLERI